MAQIKAPTPLFCVEIIFVPAVAAGFSDFDIGAYSAESKIMLGFKLYGIMSHYTSTLHICILMKFRA